MSTADISSLGNLQSGDPLDWDNYADAKEAPPPPSPGRYVFQAADQPTFSATNQNYLQAQIDPKIVGPKNAGYTLRFTKVSAKPFKRGAVTVSQLGDYLRSAGSTARPRNEQEQADAVLQTAGRTFQADTTLEAYCKACKTTQKGNKIPLNPDGSAPSWVECSNAECKAEGGGRTQVRVNAKIDRYIPAV